MSRGRLLALLGNPWLLAAVTALLAFGLAIVANRIWRADLSVPLAYTGDATQYLMYSKAIHDHGWFLENGRLGAPFALLMYDWAEGGWASMLGVRLLDALSGDWVFAHNLFYLLGYPLAALTCLWALWRLGVAPALAVALSALYAILPFHLDRQTHHYVLSLYYGLPPVLSYAVTSAAGRPPIPLRGHGLTRRQWLRRALPALGAAVLAGLMSAYYVAFAGIFVLAAGVFGWLRSRRFGVLLSAVVLGLVMGATLLVQYSPSLAYRLANGTNYDVGQRYQGETELYPLKLTDLLLPVPGHPIGALAQLRERYSNFPSRGQVGLALGIAGSTGLLLGLAGFVAAAAGRSGGDRPRGWRLAGRLRPIGYLALVGLGVGMLGGGSTILGFIVGPYLRAWDRIAIAIAFFAFAALGVTITAVRHRLRRSLRAPLLAGLAAVVLVGGTFDQAGTGVWVKPYAAYAEQWRNDGQFVEQVEALLPAGAMVYQLPFIPFPENGRGATISNDLLKPYLHSTSLRWSAGYVKGRDPGWQVVQSRGSAGQVVELLRALGFGGVVLHRDGYPATPDNPLTAAAITAQLDAELGPPAAQDTDGRLTFWLIPPAEVDEDVTQAARSPVRMYWASGFDVMYLVGESVSHRTRATAAVELRNDLPAPRDVVVRFALEPEPGTPPRAVELTWPDGAPQTVRLEGQRLVVERRLTLPTGQSRLRLRVPDAPPRGYAMTMVDLAVVDEVLAHLLPPP